MTFKAADMIPEIDAAVEKLLGYLEIEINQDTRAVLWNTLSEYITEIGRLRSAIAQERSLWRNLLIPDPSSSLDPQRAVEAHDATVREMARREAREACVVRKHEDGFWLILHNEKGDAAIHLLHEQRGPIVQGVIEAAAIRTRQP